MTNEDNGWGKWGKYVLMTIENLENRVSNVEEHQRDSEIDIVKINVKAGVVATSITIIISTLLSIIGGFIIYYNTTGELKEINTKNKELTEQVQMDKNRIEDYKILINKKIRTPEYNEIKTV